MRKRGRRREVAGPEVEKKVVVGENREVLLNFQ